MPKVSIIVPVCNGEAFLAECIDSVLAQTLDDFELLLGDDASSDSSRAILARYTDPRIRVFLNEKNVGLFANLNRLTSHASAALVRFLCQDDALEPGCLASETQYLDANPQVAMSICAGHQIDANSNVTGSWPVHPAPEIMDSTKALERLFYEGCLPGSLSTVTVRLEALRAAGLFDETFVVAGDYEMWTRVCRCGGVTDLHVHLVRLREHEKRLSRAPISGVLFVKEGRRILENLLPLLPEPIQAKARRYMWWRHNVFDTNYFISCLLRGHFGYGRRLVEIMGVRVLIPGFAAWAITLNNRLYRPKPAFSRE